MKGIRVSSKSMLRNKIYLIYLVVHLLITLCFLVYFIKLGVSAPFANDEYSRVLKVFCYICIFGLIIIILEVSATILGVVTAIYMLVCYFVSRHKKKKLNNIEQNTANIRERQRDDFVNYVYEMNGFDFKDAVHWVNSLVDKGIIVTNVITLRDTKHSYDEGNNTIQLEYPFNQEQMLNKIEKKEVDIISFNGKYKGVLIIVSYNLRNNVLVLGFNSKDNIDRVSLESELSLTGKGVDEFV